MATLMARMLTPTASPPATQASPTSNTYVAGYVRLTRDESLQTGLSAPAQRKGIYEYAKRANLAPIKIFEETKAVGGDVVFDKRAAGRQLLAAIERGETKHVIVRDLDRLTRDVGLGLELMDLCRSRGVVIHTFTGPILVKSASDRFAFHVRSAAAEFEKNQTGDRVRKAKREAAEQGRTAGPPAYGYCSQSWRRTELIRAGTNKEQAETQACTEYPHRTKWYVNEKEAEIIRVIYELADAGLGSHRIVNELNTRGYRTRMNCLWSTERLSRTINNPAAAGYVTFDTDKDDTGKSTPKRRQPQFLAKHEAIITLQHWQKVQLQRQANRNCVRPGGDPAKANRRYLLSGILKCSCGSVMRGKSYSARKPGRYMCLRTFYHGKKSINGCNSPCCTLNAARVHDVFWVALPKMLAASDLVDRVYIAAVKLQQDKQRHQSKVTGMAKELAKLDHQIEVWYRRHDEAQGPDEQEAAWRRIVELTRKRKNLAGTKTEQDKLSSSTKAITREQVAASLASMHTLIEQSNPDAGRKFVQSLAANHGLVVQASPAEQLSVSLGIEPPGTLDAEPTIVSLSAAMPKDKIAAWMIENEGKPFCELCKKPLTLLRRHYWLGFPRRHQSCHSKEMMRLRNHRDDGLLTGAAVARLLKVGDSTISRWQKAGKLPKPFRVERGTKLWKREQI